MPPEPLSIAYVSLHTSPTATPGSGDAGGMNVLERAQAEALAGCGHRLELLTRRTSADAPAVQVIAPGVTLRVLDAGPPRPVAKSAQEAYIDAFSAALAAVVKRGEARFDVVHSHHWLSGVAALPVARSWAVPHVQSYHSVAALPGRALSEGEPAESAGRVAGERRVGRDSDLVVAVSEAERRTVIERCGADPQRVDVVRPGVDADLFRPLGPAEPRWRPPGSADGRPYVLFAGRLQPLKGPDVAIEALATLPASARPLLVVAGEPSDDVPGYSDELRHLVSRCGLSGDVIFCGSQERATLAAMLRSAELLLMPSHSETFGLIALEAAASGIPVVATRAGGLVEAVRDGVSGVLLADREPRLWGQAIAALLADSPRRAAMGREGRQLAEQAPWSAVATRLAELYIAAMSGRIPTARDARANRTRAGEPV